MLLLKSLLFLVFALIWCFCSVAKDELNPFKVEVNSPEGTPDPLKPDVVVPPDLSSLPPCIVLLAAVLLVLMSAFELVTGMELYHPLRDLSFGGAWGLTGSLFNFGPMIGGVLLGVWVMASFSRLGGLMLAIYAVAFWYFGGWEMMSSVPPWSWFAWMPG